MKILVLSLLRLGDIIMQEPLFAEIKAQYPQAQVDVLINDQFLSVREIIPGIDKWIGFPRNELQAMLAKNPSEHLLAFDKLQDQLKELNQKNYDIIFNFTHNFLSARLMDQLTGKDKRGLQYKDGIKLNSQNQWQVYMNESFTELKGSRFHYLEVLANSLGLNVPKKKPAFLRQGNKILLQLFTSDPKKNWQLESFKQLMKMLIQEYPDKSVLALCSPSELSTARKYFSEAQIIAPTLSELKRILANTDLLVSGDTSVQHLAAAQNCKVLSLFMGSADAIKTSAWQLGGYSIEGAADCYPCAHSKPCHQATHICGRSIKVDKVLNFVKVLLSGNEMEKLHGRSEQEHSQGLSC